LEGGVCGPVDCSDTDGTSYPGAIEVPYNGIDENCNGMTDDDDLDGDGCGNATDCNDNDAGLNPGASEIPYNGIDENCNGMTDDDDLDKDGYGLSSDCNDAQASINPGAAESCDAIDNNCNGQTDEGLSVIGLSLPALSFDAEKGSSFPTNQTIAIANTGCTTNQLNWTAASTAAWVTLTPASGTNSGNMTVAVNASALTPGANNATITITAPGAPPVAIPVAVTSYAPLALSMTSLPSGYVGNPYSKSLTTSGGKAPVTWSVASGSLPAGLTLNANNGIITGTPTATGSKTVSLRATDSLNVTTTGTYTIAISAARADLTATSVTAPTSGTRGRKIDVASVVSNQGGAGAGNFKVSFYLSTDSTITSADRKLGEVSVSSLAEHGSGWQLLRGCYR